MVPFLQISGNRMRLALAVVLMTVGDIAFDLLNVFVFHGGRLGHLSGEADNGRHSL